MKKYKDAYGDIWIKIDKYHVQRVKDGMMGGFFYGQGLMEIQPKVTQERKVGFWGLPDSPRGTGMNSYVGLSPKAHL